jgi:uncharacterized protein
MSTRNATFYINHFNMQPHPEGGYYAIGYRSEETVDTENGKRNLYSSVYFLITKDSPSRFHRLQIDEIWHLYHGSLTLHTISEKGDYNQTRMGDEENPIFQFRIEKNTWMAAETDSFAFFGCTLSRVLILRILNLKTKMNFLKFILNTR